MDILKKIVHILSYFCYVIIGVYALVCVPMIFGSKPVVVLSGSMQPTYKVGTIIYYKPVPQEEIHAGDVITYQMGDTMVTHRVKEVVNGSEYVTQGDNNDVADGKTVSYSAVLGKIGGAAIPVLGFGVQFINNNMWVFAILIGILVLEFLLSNIKNDKISVSENKERNNNEE